MQRIYKLHRLVSSHRHPVPRTVLEQELECSRATAKRITQEMRLHFNMPPGFRLPAWHAKTSKLPK